MRKKAERRKEKAAFNKAQFCLCLCLCLCLRRVLALGISNFKFEI
jgi:hypothetical protein